MASEFNLNIEFTAQRLLDLPSPKGTRQTVKNVNAQELVNQYTRPLDHYLIERSDGSCAESNFSRSDPDSLVQQSSLYDILPNMVSAKRRADICKPSSLTKKLNSKCSITSDELLLRVFSGA